MILGWLAYVFIILSIVLSGLSLLMSVHKKDSIYKFSIVSIKKLFIFSAISFSSEVTSSFSIMMNSF